MAVSHCPASRPWKPFRQPSPRNSAIAVRWPGALFATLACAAWPGAGAAAATPTVSAYYGLCDASAVVFAGGRMIVASDERGAATRRNLLHAFVPGHPRGTPIELTGLFGSRQFEADIEGGAAIGNQQYWIGSHGAGKSGKPRPEQQWLFATRLVGNKFVPVTGGYRHLLADLAADSRYVRLGIVAAMRRAPEDDNGFNVEGLGAHGTTLLIGLRGPLIDGKALIIPLLDGPAVVAGRARASFGAPILLDLDGRGIRDLATAGGTTYILAGPSDGGGKFRLHTLTGDRLAKAAKIDFGDLHVEGLAVDPAGRIIFVSDDGTAIVGGRKCRDLPDAAQRFRVLTVTP